MTLQNVYLTLENSDFTATFNRTGSRLTVRLAGLVFDNTQLYIALNWQLDKLTFRNYGRFVVVEEK